MSENLKLYYDNSLFAAEARARAEGRAEERTLNFKLMDLIKSGKTSQLPTTKVAGLKELCD